MMRLLLPLIFKIFNKSTFLSSLNQNSCPVLDTEEIKKEEQKEAIEILGLISINAKANAMNKFLIMNLNF